MDSVTKRQFFECQEPLWLAFNELAKRLNISLDGLICEAMTLYYQQQAAASQTGAFLPVSPQNASSPYTPHEALQPTPLQPTAELPVSPGYNANNAYGGDASELPPPPPASPGMSAYPQASLPDAFAHNPIQAVAGNSSLPPPPIPSAQRVSPPASSNGYRRPPSIFDEVNAIPPGQKLQLASLSSHSIQPVQAPGPVAYPSQHNNPAGNQVNTGMPPLYIVFANQRYFVNKDKYIIGRSSHVADLVIRDGNISRKHCAIIYKNGAYYIKDLGSTNGIEYHGKQIDTKKIEEGDQFNVCEFYFTFTFK